MKYLLLLTLFLTAGFTELLAQTNNEVIRLSDPIEQIDNDEVFGNKWTANTTPKSLNEAIESLQDDKVEVVLKGVVSKVCKKKGCFFIMKDGDTEARITFKDYGFFIPTDSENKEVTLIGVLEMKEISEEKAKHYAEDQGESSEDIKGVQKEYSVVATSIRVPKTK